LECIARAFSVVAEVGLLRLEVVWLDESFRLLRIGSVRAVSAPLEVGRSHRLPLEVNGW